jgi:MerR family transcriptional regulator, light-induced transcriptional regulator
MDAVQRFDRVARHPIGVVAERTGLSQDVIRVWERRYGVVEPARTDAGQRLYSDADVERLRLLHAATLAGRSIGSVARLTTVELEQLVSEDSEARYKVPVDAGAGPGAAAVQPAMFAVELERALALARQLDGHALEGMIRRAIAMHGVPDVLDGLAAPLLRRVGEEWHAGRLTPAEEHLASASVHRAVMVAVSPGGAIPGAPVLVVATPAGERHEIGAILVAAAATASGWNVTYLGADLPALDIARTAHNVGASAVAISVVYLADRDRVLGELRALRGALAPDMRLLLGGGAAHLLAEQLAGLDVTILSDLATLASLTPSR